MVESVVRLVERGVDEDGSHLVRVSYPSEGTEFDVSVTDPASADDEQLLAWYFEQHLRFPFLDGDRRRAAVEVLREYGRDLFTQVFGGAAGLEYQLMRRRGFEGCRIEVVGGASLHRLHWEALFDPALDSPLALRIPITRGVEARSARFETAGPWPTLNILVVTARPGGANDVGYRTISRPLVDAVRQADIPVRIDFVRPGTWTGLRAHLEATRAAHGLGWYQLVHFDVHGSFADQSTMQNESRAGRYLLDGDAASFAGKQGFLFFDTGRVGVADPRSAREIAGLLDEHLVPMAVLNACQSAMQSSSEAALAQQLVEAGVPYVLGMAYSVTVTAAALAMPILYKNLARGTAPELALRLMRRQLFDIPDRQGYFDQTLPLADWVLPVAFRQHTIDIAVRPMQLAEEEAFLSREATVGEEPFTEYGFVGRDLDVQGIERRLLIDPERNQVLVQGMAGAGKSTLLTHLGWWWQRTGLVEEVFTYSYEHRAWTVDQITRDIATRLWPDKIEFATWDSLGGTARRERVARALRSQRHLLILDNTESITAAPAAIPHALTDTEQQALRSWAARLRAGRTLVMWGSREPETWIASDSFGTNTHQLGGLDPQAASVLADRILDRHHATAYRDDPEQRDALDELLKLLGGYPLPLEVVLPILASTPPSHVLEELEAGGETVDPVGLITKAIEYSHAKLDPALQTSLALLAPFTATIPGGEFLTRYQQLLNENQPSQDPWGTIDIAAGLAAAMHIGLAAPHDAMQGWVQVLPILPYFLRRALHTRHPTWWPTAQYTHYRLHTDLGNALHAMLTGNNADQRATARVATTASYANFTAAIDTALHQHQPTLPVLLPIEELLDQTRQQRAHEQLLDHVITHLAARTDPDAPRELPQLLHLAGIVAQQQRRFDHAENYYRQALDLLLESGDRHSAASTYHQLGMAAQEQRRFDHAENYYRQALDLLLEFGDRHSAAGTYHELGRVAQEQRHFDHAENYYRQALDLKNEFGDRHRAAGTYHELGRVAQEQRHFDHAENYYRQALDLKNEFGDRHSAASTYHQLGMAAQEQRRFDHAENYYRQALDLLLEFGDRHGAAGTYHQLGRVAQDQRRFDQAENYYRQALDLLLEFGDRHSAARTYHQLGTVAQDQRRFDQAENYYRQALDLLLEFGDRHSAARTYHQLGTVAQDQRRFDQAENHYRQAQQAFRDTGDERSASQELTALGSVLAEDGRHGEAFSVLVGAAVSWKQFTGVFDPTDLELLATQRDYLDQHTVDTVLDALDPVTTAALRQHLRGDSK
ncbi:tetratricopeptide repeat protein [Nocardia asteroides]|uniref:tetratricopeptide repeat protein n=1 Tax=Nocardia asteroides TaxID=1824 RepID=UPI001E4B73EC|nr:tetratricopeptide repeat protein [Nocardia asteroides]UGT59854.1 tetratricopeptide repeat protein [Nocardia asteroides]